MLLFVIISSLLIQSYMLIHNLSIGSQKRGSVLHYVMWAMSPYVGFFFLKLSIYTSFLFGYMSSSNINDCQHALINTCNDSTFTNIWLTLFSHITLVALDEYWTLVMKFVHCNFKGKVCIFAIVIFLFSSINCCDLSGMIGVRNLDFMYV